MTIPGGIVVVGASLAGLRAAEALRSEGFDGKLTIVGAEEHQPYDRPPLSKQLLTGAMTPPDVVLSVDADLGAEWVLGDPATALDLDRRIVRTHAGRDLHFDGLVIATGSVPRRLPGLDQDVPGMAELRTLDDALALRAALGGRPRVVLVGCGFIGVELASSARALGAEVSIVSSEAPLVVAGAPFSSVCAELLSDHGVDLRIGRQVHEVMGHGRVEAVALDDGTCLDADLVVVAVGARPATDWLKGSGMPLDDGVVCDASSAVVGTEGIVAAGDVARWPNPIFDGAPMRIEHWSNAVTQGGAAARTLLHGSGPATPYGPVPGFWSDHFGTRLQSVGLPRLADRVEVVDGSISDRRFVAAAYRGEELVGATTYGMVPGLVPYRIALGRRAALTRI